MGSSSSLSSARGATLGGFRLTRAARSRGEPLAEAPLEGASPLLPVPDASPTVAARRRAAAPASAKSASRDSFRTFLAERRARGRCEKKRLRPLLIRSLAGRASAGSSARTRRIEASNAASTSEKLTRSAERSAARLNSSNSPKPAPQTRARAQFRAVEQQARSRCGGLLPALSSVVCHRRRAGTGKKPVAT